MWGFELRAGLASRFLPAHVLCGSALPAEQYLRAGALDSGWFQGPALRTSLSKRPNFSVPWAFQLMHGDGGICFTEVP